MQTRKISEDKFHIFLDKQIDQYKAKKGRAFFYKKPKNRIETLGEKRIMRFDTRYREFQVDGATGKRIVPKGKERTTTPDKNMKVYDLDIKEGNKIRNVPLNYRLKYLLIGKKCLKISYLGDYHTFKVEFPKLTRDLIKKLYAKEFEDKENNNEWMVSE
mgnify:FL=1